MDMNMGYHQPRFQQDQGNTQTPDFKIGTTRDAQKTMIESEMTSHIEGWCLQPLRKERLPQRTDKAIELSTRNERKRFCA